MTKFRPSSASLTPKKRAEKSIAYARAALNVLDSYLKEVGDDDVPDWVLTRINQAAALLGQAVSFVQFKTAKKKKKKKEKEG